MPDDEATPKPLKADFVRTSDFVSSYANSFILESSTWDLKLIFGQLDQSTTPNTVQQHLAVTLPWTQVKLLSYYLRVHLKAEEMQDGKIHIRPDVRPNEPDPPTEEQAKDPSYMELYEFVKKLREEFIAEA